MAGPSASPRTTHLFEQSDTNELTGLVHAERSKAFLAHASIRLGEVSRPTRPGGAQRAEQTRQHADGTNATGGGPEQSRAWKGSGCETDARAAARACLRTRAERAQPAECEASKSSGSIYGGFSRRLSNRRSMKRCRRRSRMERTSTSTTGMMISWTFGWCRSGANYE